MAINYGSLILKNYPNEFAEIGSPSSPAPASLSTPPSADSPELVPALDEGYAQEASGHGGRRTRGIINPNYPGFQHFAHALAEHFKEVPLHFHPDGMALELSCNGEEDDSQDVDGAPGTRSDDSLASLEFNSSAEESAVDDRHYNLNVIVNEILAQAVEETIAISTVSDSLKDEVSLETNGNGEDSCSLIEDNYNNLLMRCQEKIFCEVKHIPVDPEDEEDEELNGNSLALSGDADCGRIVTDILSINDAKSDSLITLLPRSDDDDYTRDCVEVVADKANNLQRKQRPTDHNELNSDEIDASAGNYLSSDASTYPVAASPPHTHSSVDTIHEQQNDAHRRLYRKRSCHRGDENADELSVEGEHITAIQLRQQLHHPLSLSYNCKDADGNSVTDVKGLGGRPRSGSHDTELIQMTPDILIKNISLNANVVLDSNVKSPSFSSFIHSSIGATVSHPIGRQMQRNIGINGIHKCDPFEPDLLRNIEVRQKFYGEDDYEEDGATENFSDNDSGKLHEIEQQATLHKRKVHHLSSDSESDNKLSFEENTEIHRQGENGNEEPEVVNSISSAATTVAGKEKGCTATKKKRMATRTIAPLLERVGGDTLGDGTNNLNNNGICIESYTWGGSQDENELSTGYSGESVEQQKDINGENGLAAATKSPHDGDVEEKNFESCMNDQGAAHNNVIDMGSSTDVMVAMFNGTLWNSSPIDIVGDFGGEIERELGLISSGRRGPANYQTTALQQDSNNNAAIEAGVVSKSNYISNSLHFIG